MGYCRKSYKHDKRLKAAPALIAVYTGKSVVRGYMKWFRVDRLCAIRELIELGVAVPESEIPRKKTDAEKAADAEYRRLRKAGKLPVAPDSDETYAFIAGYTSGGAPYGTTWEEMAALQLGDTDDPFAD